MATKTRDFLKLKIYPKTTAPYPGQARYSTEFSAIVGSPVNKTINQIRGIVRSEANKYVRELESQSPVGHTKNLSRRWKVFTETKSSGRDTEIYARISNTAPYALFRIVGRAPGKMPPMKSLKAWAKSKGLKENVAYAIRNKIARYGTERWRTGKNMAGIRPGVLPSAAYSSFYKRNNIVSRFLDRVAARLS